MTNELRPIPGHSLYLLSRDGEVFKTVKNKRSPNHPMKRLTTWLGGDGRVRVNLWRKGVQTQCSIHRLLAMTFIGPAPDDKSVVRHLNGDAADNRIENLAWGSHVDNMADARQHGSYRNERNGRTRLTSEIVRDARTRKAAGASTASLAREHGVAEATMHYALSGHTWRDI